MRLFSRFFSWLGFRGSPPEHDFGGAIGTLPLHQASSFIRLHITADSRILVDDRPVPVLDLERVLRAAYRPGTVINYSREHYDLDEPLVDAVFDCVGRLGLPIALPPELTAEFNQYYAENPPAGGVQPQTNS